MGATATPQHSTEAEFEAIKRTLAARDAENHSLRQALDARDAALAERNTAYSERIEHQAAMIDVLKAMSASPGDEQPVLELVARRAREQCSAETVGVFTFDGKLISVRFIDSVDMESLEAFRSTFPRPPSRDYTIGRSVLDRAIVEINDADADPGLAAVVHAHRNRSIITLPFMIDGDVVGGMSIAVRAAGGLTDTQKALARTFAEQASIAIRSAETFRALQQRTGDLAESLEYQTATSEVLKVISSSSFDLTPVFQAVVATAVRLCRADQASIYRFHGGEYRWVAGHSLSPDYERIEREVRIQPGTGTLVGRVALQRSIVQILDAWTDPLYEVKEDALVGGVRTMLGVPLLRDGVPIGVIGLARRRIEPYTQPQIDLITTFADQAVIAIENARLFDEVQARTRELTEALELQTATADVLKAISRTAFDLDTVLRTLIETALRLCNATTGQIFRREGDVYRHAATHFNIDPAYFEHEKRVRICAGRSTLVGRVALEKRTVLIDDAWNDPEYGEKNEARIGNVRAMLGVPLMRDGEPIGAFALARATPTPFTPREVNLVTTFADQAVIAIENVRLFDEVQARTKELAESLQIQSATADVLKAISRSAFDLDVVLDTLIRSAAKLCNANTGVILIRDGKNLRSGASFNQSPALATWIGAKPRGPGRDSISARVALSHSVEQVLDVQAEPDFDPALKAATINRTSLGVPMLRQGQLEGVFVLGRMHVEPFNQRQIELVQTFADQALIAIENARLFNEVQARTRELAKSLDELRTAQDRLIQTEKLASLGQLTAGIAHEIKNPLNFVNNFSALSVDLLEELQTALAPAPLAPATRAEVDEVTGLLRGNLQRVVQHGKRADGIVRNMLLHAREGSGERREVDFNATVEEALTLAYHGARAEKPGFNVTLERHFDPMAGSIELYPQEFTRVLLNLIGNGFYAVDRRRRDSDDAAYSPTVAITTKARPDAVIVRVRDNGIGVPDTVKARLFEPFFTTKPAGEGTGLGLSISHDIVVKQHSGSIAVDSRPGEYTEFTITLPRTSAGAPA